MSLFNREFGGLQVETASVSVISNQPPGSTRTHEAVDDIVIFGVLNDLQDLGDDPVDLGAGTAYDNDVLLGLADAHVDWGVFAENSTQDRARWTDDVPVPFLPMRI
jgi:hypothetical protein